MILLALSRSSRRSSSYLQHLAQLTECSFLSSTSKGGSSNNIPNLDVGAVVTGSLSGAKHVSKLVPPSFFATTPLKTKNEARLLVSGPDATGIVASFSQLLYGHGCGIVDCTSESSEEDDYNGEGTVVVKDRSCTLQHHGKCFFQRILFDYSNITVERSVVEREVESACEKFGMESHLVSTYFACLVSAPSYELYCKCSYLFTKNSHGETKEQRWQYSLANMITACGNCSCDIGPEKYCVIYH